MKKLEVQTVRLTTRLYDEQLLKDIEALVASGRYESKSDVVARCIELALPTLTRKGTLEGTANKADYDIERAMKRQAGLIKELSVNQTMLFALLTSLFTERVKSLNGLRTNGDDLANGIYENLPPFYADRLSELMKIL